MIQRGTEPKRVLNYTLPKTPQHRELSPLLGTNCMQTKPHLLQQGLHLPLLTLLPAPIWVALQAIKVGLSSPWKEHEPTNKNPV